MKKVIVLGAIVMAATFSLTSCDKKKSTDATDATADTTVVETAAPAVDTTTAPVTAPADTTTVAH